MPVETREQENKEIRMLTIKEVAHYLSVNERTIYRLIKANKIPGVKIGGQWRFSEQSLQSWIAQKMEFQPQGNKTSVEP
jgi:excisionase family DNA binding protein